MKRERVIRRSMGDIAADDGKEGRSMTADLYERFVDILGGGLTQRAAVNAVLIERVECGSYRRDRLLLTAGERMIPLYLLLPRADGPRPAILAHHQHNGEYHLGKSEPAGIAGNPEMHYARRLAERGYVVAAWDALGFEERHNPLFGRLHEQFLGTRALAEGACLQREYTLDAMYVADYLLSRPEADPERLGTIGHSLGGQNVLFNLLVDSRVRAGVSSCGIATVRCFLEESVQHNLAWYVPGILKLGDTPGLAPLLAGKALFISQGSRDPIFPLRGVEMFTAAARPHAAVELRVFDGGHSFPEAAQDAAYAFLDQHLGGERP
jgi:dienelactone hydrolase